MSLELTAQLLQVSGRTYAGFAAGTLLEGGNSKPQTADLPGAFDLWKAHFEQRLGELATALTFSQPELFAAGMRWAREAFLARGMPAEDLELGLEALEEVLSDELPSSSGPSLLPYLEAARRALDQAAENAAALEPTSEPARAALRFLEAALGGSSREAIQVLEAAQDNGLTALDLCDQVLAPAQREIGRLWHASEIGVAQEHFATEIAKKALALMFGREEAKPANGKTAVIACPHGNSHDLGLLMLTEVFENEGWRTIFLGDNIPLHDLTDAIGVYEPELLMLSASLSQHLLPLRETIRAVRAETAFETPFILVGGSALDAVPTLWKELGADGWAGNARDAVREAAQLVGL